MYTLSKMPDRVIVAGASDAVASNPTFIEIKKKTEGIYAVVNFTATSDATVELDRQLKLSEAVMRTKVLRAEEAVARAGKIAVEDEQRAARKAAAAAKKPKVAAEKDAE